MIKFKASILFLTLIAFTFLNFTPAEDNQNFLKTNLRITIVNDLGREVKGATVTLYATESDYRSSTNPIAGPKETNNRGNVTFKGLEGKAYYVHAFKGEMNNNMLGIKTDKLEEGKLNKVSLAIAK